MKIIEGDEWKEVIKGKGEAWRAKCSKKDSELSKIYKTIGTNTLIIYGIIGGNEA